MPTTSSQTGSYSTPYVAVGNEVVSYKNIKPANFKQGHERLSDNLWAIKGPRSWVFFNINEPDVILLELEFDKDAEILVDSWTIRQTHKSWFLSSLIGEKSLP